MLDRDDDKYHHGYWDGPNSNRKWMILKLLLVILFIVGSLSMIWSYLDPFNTKGITVQLEQIQALEREKYLLNQQQESLKVEKNKLQQEMDSWKEREGDSTFDCPTKIC